MSPNVLIASFTGGVAGAALCLFLQPAPPDASRAGARPARAARAAAEPERTRADLETADRLSERVALLEGAVEALPQSRAPAPDTSSAAVPPDIHERLRRLEDDLMALREELRARTIEPEPTASPSRTQSALRNAIVRADVFERIELQTRFLELWPTHDSAPDVLADLASDYVDTGQAHKATAALDRFEYSVNLTSEQAADLRSRIADGFR